MSATREPKSLLNLEGLYNGGIGGGVIANTTISIFHFEGRYPVHAEENLFVLILLILSF